MKEALQAILWLITIATLNYNCKKETSCEGCIDGNKPPIAIAGPDQTTTLPVNHVSLDGRSSSDADGTISSFQWSKISGPASFNLTNSTTSQSTAGSLEQGVYLLELKVTDDKNLTDTDTVQVIVSDPPQSNQPPIANAGPDVTISLPVNSVTLNGINSTDPDNNIVSYFWTKISGPNPFAIADANGIVTQLTSLTEGAYRLELKVTDAGGLVDLDTIQVNVNPIPATGNVLFFFRDPTGSLDAANIGVIENFSPQIILARVKIESFPDANIEGVWSLNATPWCPISSMYYDATSYGTFNLPPGTYTWTAESVTTNLTTLVPAGFATYWSLPHNASGTILVQPGNNCVIKEIIF